MSHARPMVTTLVLMVALAVGCRDDQADPTATAPVPTPTVATPTPDPTPPPRLDRIAPREMAALGSQEGFVDGGMIHAAVRPATVLPYLRSIPLPGEVARELAELSEESGVDWRAENIERRFALAPGAAISMTLLRPVANDLADLRGELMRGGSVLDAIAIALQGSEVGSAALDEKPPVEARAADAKLPSAMPKPPAVATEPLELIPPTEPKPEIVEPKVPSLSAAELEWGRKLAGISSALALHSRFSVQVTDPRPILEHVRLRAPASAQIHWAKECAEVSAALCVGDGELAVVIRGTERAVTVDVLMFAARSREVTPAQRKAVLDAVGLAATTTDLGLRGDAAAAIDANAIVAFVDLDAVRLAISTLRYAGDTRDQEIREQLAAATAFSELMRAPQLFTGARLDAAIDGENLQAELRWLLVPGQADASRAAFEVVASKAPVPTLGPLCDGALFCFRTTGLPRPSTLANQLGIGVWGRGPDVVERGVGRFDEALVAHMMAASWPNFLGALARLPALELGGGPEGAMASSLLDMIGRVEGTGGSLRSATVSHRRIAADYVVYARTSVSDAGLPRGMLSLAGETMRDVTLPGSGGPASEFTVPEDDFPATLITRTDPAVGGVPSTTAWIALVDAGDRMSWLLALPTEAPGGPAAYAEIPDLGRLLPAIPELARELESARGFLEGRSLRASLELDAGEPVMRAALTRTP